MTETLLALTIFKDEFESTFVLLFVSLLFLKVFHWLASDRIEAVSSCSHAPRGLRAHARLCRVLDGTISHRLAARSRPNDRLTLAPLDRRRRNDPLRSGLYSGRGAYGHDHVCIRSEPPRSGKLLLARSPGSRCSLVPQYMILVASVWATSMKYIITCIDMRREAPWEEKSIYVFYVELIAGPRPSSCYRTKAEVLTGYHHTPDFFKLVTYLTFFGLTLTFYGLPLNILRDVYLTLRSFLLRIRDLRRYRLATKNMDTLYPNATREEMDAMSDKTCIICREDMEFQPVAGEQAPAQDTQTAATAPPATTPRSGPRGPNETPKKLPCGHVFHFHCLKSWLERQQSCPTW